MSIHFDITNFLTSVFYEMPKIETIHDGQQPNLLYNCGDVQAFVPIPLKNSMYQPVYL